tara:strand:+ start:169 stop:348 length:180 start_codon:yes stop_codon:yes gene_type:complete
MYIRNNKGKLVFVDMSKIKSDKELYCNIWKIKYNINLRKKEMKFNSELINFVNGNNIFE